MLFLIEPRPQGTLGNQTVYARNSLCFRFVLLRVSIKFNGISLKSVGKGSKIQLENLWKSLATFWKTKKNNWKHLAAVWALGGAPWGGLLRNPSFLGIPPVFSRGGKQTISEFYLNKKKTKKNALFFLGGSVKTYAFHHLWYCFYYTTVYTAFDSCLPCFVYAFNPCPPPTRIGFLAIVLT